MCPRLRETSRISAYDRGTAGPDAHTDTRRAVLGKWNPPLPFPFLAIGCVLLLRSNRAKQHPLPLPLPTPARAERPTGPRRRPIDLSIDRLIQSIDRQGAAGGRGAGQSPSVGVSLPRTSALLPVICVPSMSSSSSSPGTSNNRCVLQPGSQEAALHVGPRWRLLTLPALAFSCPFPEGHGLLRVGAVALGFLGSRGRPWGGRLVLGPRRGFLVQRSGAGRPAASLAGGSRAAVASWSRSRTPCSHAATVTRDRDGRDRAAAALDATLRASALVQGYRLLLCPCDFPVHTLGPISVVTMRIPFLTT